jgi:hypothetical protein
MLITRVELLIECFSDRQIIEKNWRLNSSFIIMINTFKSKRIPFCVKSQKTPRRHFQIRLYKNNQLILSKAKVAVCSEIYEKVINILCGETVKCLSVKRNGT